jgi:steroid 5-alpha reductase family enzyme
LSPTSTALLTAGVAVVTLMVLTWLLSLAKRNASIVDIAWGLGFVIVAWSIRMRLPHPDVRSAVLVGMTTIWGLRLAGYLYLRNHGKGEDFRYRAMRKKYGSRFAFVSLGTVFAVQGLLMWIVSLPIQLGQTRHTSLGPLTWIGLVVWLVGLGFEGVGDYQLARFKRDPTNQGSVMDIGLWRYTRHPNYFGDACVWWGIALVAAESGIGAVGIIGATVMTVLLRRVSGVTLLEKSLVKRRPGYTEYVQRTSPFVPRPPRR